MMPGAGLTGKERATVTGVDRQRTASQGVDGGRGTGRASWVHGVPAP